MSHLRDESEPRIGPELLEGSLQSRHRQFAAVAALAQVAIRANDLTPVLDGATALVKQTLGTEFSLVMKLLPQNERFQVLSLQGWSQEFVGHVVPLTQATMSAYMLQTGDPVVTSDVRTERRFAIASLVASGVVSGMGVVIPGRTRLWGILSTYTSTGRSFDEVDVGFLQSIANVLALAVEHQQVENANSARADAEAALERLRAIQSILEPVESNGELDVLLREMLARLRQALHADFASVALVDEKRNALCIRVVDGQSPPTRAESIVAPLGTGISGRIAADGIPRIVNDLATVDFSGIQGISPEQIRATTQSVVGVPLRIAGKVIGVVTASSGRPRVFTEEDLQLLSLVADRVAPAIERVRLIETVHAGRKRLKALSTRLLTAQEEERRRLAVELHDELGQVLTAVKINLESLKRVPGVTPVLANLKDAIVSVDEAMSRVRDLALDLRPSVLDDLGLPAALRWYGDRFARESQVATHLSIDPISYLEPEIEIACFRIAQEALTNIARHAHAKNVWIDLRLTGAALALTLLDDGIGFDVAAARSRAIGGGSLGMLGMEERVSLLGGEFEIQSSRGAGTEVSVRFQNVERSGLAP